jgi:purine nucleoside permease
MDLKRGVSSAIPFVALLFAGPLIAQQGAPNRKPVTKPIEVRVVVVANFENGADMGDAPGEYQFWVEREHLDEKVPVRGAPDVVRRNRDGLYGLCLRHGVTDLAAFVLDPRFDLHKTYWLFTGISGVDPRAASVGSVAWARWVINGDELREIDDRSIPAGWPYGLWAIGASRPNQLPYDPNHFGSVTKLSQLSMAYPLNQGLARWAFDRTRNVQLANNDTLRAEWAEWKEFPNAQRPPFVLMGETLGSVRYWHGDRRTRWAEDWTKLWTGGRGLFVMTNMESQTYEAEMRVLGQQGFVDLNRVMVLRSASNFSEPPPGQSPVKSIGDEHPGQVVAFDNNQRVGSPVLHELLKHWERYENSIPSAAQ